MKTYLLLLISSVIMLVFSACQYRPKDDDRKGKIAEVRMLPDVADPDDKAGEKDYAVDVELPPADENIAYDRIVMPPVAKPVATEKKIIKSGDITFETGNVAATRMAILKRLKIAGGYVEEDNETDEGRKEFLLNIRVPAKNFDAFLSTVTATATKVDSKNIRVKDVTTEYIDTKTRLDNKKILETRYLDLLKRAVKISEMLEIENKLADIRSDIESTQGQLNYMSSQVAYSSLSITFYTTRAAQVETNEGFGHQLTRALSSGLDVLQGVFFAFIALWPLWIGIGVIYFVIKKWRRRAVRTEAD